jgi:hypothetical protein
MENGKDKEARSMEKVNDLIAVTGLLVLKVHRLTPM